MTAHQALIEAIRAGRVQCATVTRTELHDAADALEAAASNEGLLVSLAVIFNMKAAWSLVTFGPDQRVGGVLAHIRKELVEIERDPTDVVEWIDVVMLAMDGAWRAAGADGKAFAAAFFAKHKKNTERTWPDWRTASPDAPIEHVRDLDERLAACVEVAKEPSRAEAVASHEVRVARSSDGTIATASEIYVDGRLFVSADSVVPQPPTAPFMDPMRAAMLALLNDRIDRGELRERLMWEELSLAVRR